MSSGLGKGGPEAPELSDADIEALLTNADGKTRCQSVFTCEEHGENACPSRARWVGQIEFDDGCVAIELQCDACHDELDEVLLDFDFTEQLAGHKPVRIEWREL